MTRKVPELSVAVIRPPEATLTKAPERAVELRTVKLSLFVAWNGSTKETTRLPLRATVPLTLRKPYWLPWTRPLSWKVRFEAASRVTLPLTTRPVALPRAGCRLALLVMAALIVPLASTRPALKRIALGNVTVPPARRKVPPVCV